MTLSTSSTNLHMIRPSMNIPIARPILGNEEKEAIIAVLESGQLAQGKWVAEFEQQFADYHGARYAVATNNGTTALVASLMAHGIGPGDEVIIPSFSFFATASSVVSVGATPIFADIDPQTYCLSPQAAEAAITSKTKAIMPVHLYGHPADMPRFEALCRKYELILLEDAAQAHGAAIGERHVGTWGTASFSFYPTKNMTTIEGGMVLTNDEALAHRLRMIRNHGMNQQYLHEMMGYNFRMSNLTAAIGTVQLKSLPEWTRQRVTNADYFTRHLHRVQLPHHEPNYLHTFHQFTVRVPNGQNRDAIVERLNQKGVGARVYYPLPLHQQPVLQKTGRYRNLSLPETEKAAREVLSLPVHPSLTDIELDYIVREMNTSC